MLAAQPSPWQASVAAPADYPSSFLLRDPGSWSLRLEFHRWNLWKKRHGGVLLADLVQDGVFQHCAQTG